MLKNTSNQYGSLTKFLHWLLFACLVVQLGLTWNMFIAPDDASLKPQYIFFHKSMGQLIWLVAAIFFLWRLANSNPALPLAEAKWKRVAARIVQHCMLLLLLVLPILGYLLSASAGRTISFFGLFNLPSLISPDKALNNLVYAWHVNLAMLLFILIALHILAALHHHFVIKDNVLKRML